MKLARVIHLIPIKTFLIYFIIISFLLIAFKYPFDEAIPKKITAQEAVVSFTVNPTPIPQRNCTEGATWTQKCGLGPCESIQITECINDSWVTELCPGRVLATDEVCDGIDNNCDGYIDNGLTPPHCELTLGVCNGSYYKKCSGTSGWSQCIDSDYNKLLYEPSERTCFDGYDNDCDGATDYMDRDCVNRDIAVANGIWS